MTEYICEKCNKSYKSKSALTRHLNQKNPCVNVNITIIDSDTEDESNNDSDNDSDNFIVQDIYKVEECGDEPLKINDLSKLKYIDLFCGVGGFHQALNKLGAQCILACDIDKDCRVVYKDNYGIEPVSNVKDIDEKLMPDFDILCAGFPCFVAGTLVSTNNGYKKIEDITLDDKLLTHTGKIQNILNLQTKKYQGKLYNLNIKHHPEPIMCTEEHPFYVRNIYHSNLPQWKKACDLTHDDYCGMVINNKNIIPYFDKISNLNLNDAVNWFKIGNYIRNGLSSEIDNNFIISCSKILEMFIFNGNTIVPEFVHDLPKELIRQFIYGYFNNSTHNGMSLELAYSFQRLYLKLGVLFNIQRDLNSLGYLLIECPDNEYSVLIKEDNYVWFKINDIMIHHTENQLVYNFEVENDNSYVVQNVIVHNCQAFSNGGKKKCFDDERGLLFDEIIRIAKEKKPKFMFLENVKHILKVSKGEVIAYIKDKIAKSGYKLQLFQISPHNYGIPQQRERVYFVCVRNDIYNGKEIKLPTFIGNYDFKKFLDNKDTIDDKYFIKGDVLNVLEAWDIMVKKFEVGEKISPTILINDAYRDYTEQEFNDFPDWKKEYMTKNRPLIEKYSSQFESWYNEHSNLLQKREIYGKLEWQTGPIKANDTIFNHFIQIRQSGIRVKRSQYFPTLVAISQIPIYGKEKRYITPRECARLQSFPETFKLSNDDKKSYKQMGNSVNVDNVFTVINSTFNNYSSCI